MMDRILHCLIDENSQLTNQGTVAATGGVAAYQLAPYGPESCHSLVCRHNIDAFDLNGQIYAAA
jgi:hypothetical protein